MSNFSKNLLNIHMYYFVDFSSFSLLCSFILCNFLGFIVNKFSMFNIVSLSFLAFIFLLVYLFFSIYFSMCYLASAKLRIAVSNFSKNFLDIQMYYLVNFSSFSLHYSFILCYLIILSFTVKTYSNFSFRIILWWAQMESNHRPHAYQACALTI